MSNALHENLANVRIETDDGDLLPAMGVAGEKLAQLILAVSANQKPGTLTLKITVRRPLPARWRSRPTWPPN